MPKPLIIAAVAVVALLLVAVVVLLVQQTMPPRPTPASSSATGTPQVASSSGPSVLPPKPTHTPSTVITTERTPGTDLTDPTVKPLPEMPPPAPPVSSIVEPPAPAPPSTAPSPVPLVAVAPTTAPADSPELQPVPRPLPLTIVPPPTTLPTTTPSDASRTYKVQSGDTLTSIAQKNLGSESRWHEIAEANPMIDPIKLRVGQVLKMPPPPGSNEPRPATQPRDSAGRIIYIVRPLDTLATISKQYYGTRDYWKTIYSANRGSIGSNPDKLEPGTKLIIPPAPQPAR